jgi:hypothetical protein
VFEFEQWMLDGMYDNPLFIPNDPTLRTHRPYYSTIAVNEPGASLRLVYADMMEEAGAVTDANYLREIIKYWYWYFDDAPRSISAQCKPTIPKQPPTIAKVTVAYTCRTRDLMYLTTDGKWSASKVEKKTGQQLYLCSRSKEVRWQSLVALQKTLRENEQRLPRPLQSWTAVLVAIENPDGVLCDLARGDWWWSQGRS